MTTETDHPPDSRTGYACCPVVASRTTFSMPFDGFPQVTSTWSKLLPPVWELLFAVPHPLLMAVCWDLVFACVSRLVFCVWPVIPLLPRITSSSSLPAPFTGYNISSFFSLQEVSHELLKPCMFLFEGRGDTIHLEITWHIRLLMCGVSLYLIPSIRIYLLTISTNCSFISQAPKPK